MPLTVLRNIAVATPADLIRLYHQSQLEWCRHLGEEAQLDFGRWISNPSLVNCDDANCLLDAFLFPGISPAQLLAEMANRCRQASTPWRKCTINPSVPTGQTTPLTEMLQSSGWMASSLNIQYRKKGDGDLFSPPDLTIIPSRASYRHYHQLMDEREPGTADIALMHLDDPHVDSLLALRGTEPVGCISVLSAGEIGTIREWYVSAHHRRTGIGGLLLDRALEICVRGLLRHVMIGVDSSSEIASNLCAKRGFVSIGHVVSFFRS
jgi:GNAT superfamily N-acetyltransferase